MNFKQFYLKEANLSSDAELIASLGTILNDKGVDQQSPITAWFKSQYLKWFKSNIDDDKKPVVPHQSKEGEPEWMSRPGIVDFKGFEDSAAQKIGHMVDYLKTLSDIELKSLYKEPYAVITNKIDQWEKTLSKKMETAKLSPLTEGTDFEVLTNTKDSAGQPLRWVKLLTKAAFKFEGNSMGHCVGGYNPDKKGLTIISLYDKDNLPHVTLEVQGKNINQIKGKQNAAPIEKYQDACMKFVRYLVDQKSYKVTGDGENIGMQEDTGKFYFEDSKEWQEIWNTKILPRQQKAFDEIKKRIKTVASEQFEYINKYVKQLLKEDCRCV